MTINVNALVQLWRNKGLDIEDVYTEAGALKAALLILYSNEVISSQAKESQTRKVNKAVEEYEELLAM